MTLVAHGPARAPVDVPEVRRLRYDPGDRPFLVLVETTRACDLACRHCRAEAQPTRDPGELTTAELRGLLEDLAEGGAPRPIVVLTGGDPFKRPDLAHLVAHGASLGLAMAVSPSGTPLATASNLERIAAAGAGSVSFSLDGASAETHDDFRRVPGSFRLTLDACRAAVAAGMRVQVNTTVTAGRVHELAGMARLVEELGATLWSVFFLVPTGRGRRIGALDARATEDVLLVLSEIAEAVPLKTTEAPQFRRILHQRAVGGTAEPGPLYDELRREAERQLGPLHAAPEPGVRPRRPPLAVGDGRGVVFISHVGDVFPSGFLPLAAGNVRNAPLTEIYRSSPLLRALRDRGRLGGRCGRCEFREVCGGSRAQAYAATGDPLAEDPTCPYEPTG